MALEFSPQLFEFTTNLVSFQRESRKSRCTRFTPGQMYRFPANNRGSFALITILHLLHLYPSPPPPPSASRITAAKQSHRLPFKKRRRRHRADRSRKLSRHMSPTPEKVFIISPINVPKVVTAVFVLIFKAASAAAFPSSICADCQT